MAAGPHTFMICSVFCPEKFKGNRLAIVAVRGHDLTSDRKSLIAKEFGYSETAFLHDALGPGLPRRVEIYTEEGKEVSFAGHPIIGVAHYIFSFCPVPPPSRSNGSDDMTTVLTKAGPIPIMVDRHRHIAACAIPHDFHVHRERLPMETVLNRQPQIQIVPTFTQVAQKSFPIVSIVKDMTFALIDLSEAPEVLAALRPGKAPEVTLDEDWKSSFVGALYYVRKKPLETDGEPNIHAIQARMISHDIEDPGTGSACSALACYLALSSDATDSSKKMATNDNKGELAEDLAKVTIRDTDQDVKAERHVFGISQGVEMGRECTIAVEVDVTQKPDSTRHIAGVRLSGRATFFAMGQLFKS